MITSLDNYIKNPRNDKNNFFLALEYFKLRYYSPASGLFLRCSELSSDPDLVYESLLNMYFCYKELEGRLFTCNSILKNTLAQFPDRPEVLYHLAKLSIEENKWMDAYMYSSMGIKCAKNVKQYSSDLRYKGVHNLYMEKAFSSWWVGKSKETRQIYQYVLKNLLDDLNEEEKKYLEDQIIEKNMALEKDTFLEYSKEDTNNFPYTFDNKDKIDKNFSQCLQDMFVLYCLNGKENGTYLEIGSAYPYYGNNTALLEHTFNWTGVGIENDPKKCNEQSIYRKNPVILADALLIDYDKLIQKYLPGCQNIDFLQLDIEPVDNTYEALLNIPFDKYKFAVITYEHDDYADITQSYKQKSREFLSAKGYYLAVPDVSPINGYSFEDWWVHPDLVDIDHIKNFALKKK